MSIKIYTGFTVDTNSLEELVRLIDIIRPVLLKKQDQFYRDFITKWSDPQMFEDKTLDNKSRRNSAYNLWETFRAEVRKGLRNPLVDTQFQLIFYPFEGRFYGQAFTEQDEWFQQWLQMPLVSDFHYQNQTDQPDDVTDAEWRNRKRVWDSIFKTCSIPAMIGFTIDITDPNGPNPYRIANEDRGQNHTT